MQWFRNRRAKQSPEAWVGWAGPLLQPMAITMGLAAAGPALGFVPEVRWSSTASGPAGARGNPITLTWSLVRDGTEIPGEGPSNLISLLDAQLGQGPGEADFTERPWFAPVAQSFGRFSELSGVNFIYEPNDDAAVFGRAVGQLGLRGDIRLAGAELDGPGGTIAFSHFPNNADIAFDTSDVALFSRSQDNYVRLRNVLQHEIGHALGLAHVESNDADFLMEPRVDLSFDGPQLDDIRGLHWFYGDALENVNGGQGINTTAEAFDLGVVHPGATVSIGADAWPDTVVADGDVDFVSISHTADFDYYSFSIDHPSTLNFALAPRGGVFRQAVVGETQAVTDATSTSDLTLAVYGTNGTSLIASANEHPAGGTESINNLSLPDSGTYFARVSGASAIVQLYQLDVSVIAAIGLPAGDYNQDGKVSAADYTVWRDLLGQDGPDLAADGNRDNVIDQGDYEIWRSDFGGHATSATGSTTTSSIPEPSSLTMAAFSFLMYLCAKTTG